jgi:hypothetical protein
MIQNISFRRKVLYLCTIALLLFPLYMIGRPAAGDPATDPEARPGGTLAQLRSEYDLSLAELGEIDPASESMKLATLGMRGVAATVLWSKANEYKKKENWEALVATVNQMAKLQPNFVSVWEFQSHNLSYNVSVEQDDYRFRYQWVKKGIEFLIKGTHYNRKEPILFHTVGWYNGQKFGRADEHEQFRRLFRDDGDFHLVLTNYVDLDGQARGADGRPDNWLTSRLWYNRAYDLVDTQGAPLRGKSHHIFFADGPKARMNYAATIESEGYLDERAEYAWEKAGEEWQRFGERLVPTSWGVNVRLNDEEMLRERAIELEKELDSIAVGKREEIRQEKYEQLDDELKAALDIPWEEITDVDVYYARLEAEERIDVANREVAQRAPRDMRARAFELAKEATDSEEDAGRINKYRSNVNFVYWRTRCEVEQMPEAVKARQHIYEAGLFKEQGELEQAEQEYNQAWALWAEIMEQYPDLVQQLTAEDLYEDIERYIELLGQLEKRIAPDFELMPVIEMFGELPDYVRPSRTADEPASGDAEDAQPDASPETAEPTSPDADPPPESGIEKGVDQDEAEEADASDAP